MDNNRLNAFLHPVAVEDQEIIISKRFLENGDPIPFRIRAITQEESEELTKKCTTYTKDRSGHSKRNFDSLKFTRSLVVAGTVFPDFSSKELCDAYGVIDPLLVAPKMLLAGEYNKLADAIAEISGLNEEDVEEEAKN